MCELAVSVDDWTDLRRLARKSTTVSRPRGTCLVVTCGPRLFCVASAIDLAPQWIVG